MVDLCREYARVSSSPACLRPGRLSLRREVMAALLRGSGVTPEDVSRKLLRQVFPTR
jgi:hypothetical protein